MRLSPALLSTRYLKVVVCFGDNLFLPLSHNCLVIKVLHNMYLCNISGVGYQYRPISHPSTNPVQQGLISVDQRESVFLDSNFLIST